MAGTGAEAGVRDGMVGLAGGAARWKGIGGGTAARKGEEARECEMAREAHVRGLEGRRGWCLFCCGVTRSTYLAAV